MNELILYTTEDSCRKSMLRADQQTVWLTQLDLAELLGDTEQNISLHLKYIFQDGALDPAAVVKDSLTTGTDGKSCQTLYRTFPIRDALRRELSRTHYWPPKQRNEPAL